MDLMSHLDVSGVYGLVHRETGRVYVGQSGRSVRKRIQSHIGKAKAPIPTQCIHRAIREFGVDAFDVELIEEVSDTSLRLQREEFWIRFFKSAGTGGFNTMVKGDANSLGRSHSVASKARMSAAHKRHKYWVGRKHTAETKEKLRLCNLGKRRGPHTAEAIAKISAAKMGHSVSAEGRIKMSEAARRRVHSPETCKKRAVSIKQSWDTGALSKRRKSLC